VDEHAELSISTDKSKLDIPMIHSFLSERSYWAQGRALEVVKRSIENSLCFGMYERGRQIGFCRVITDRASFAWLADVFILESHRGRGLSKWLVQTVIAHPDLQGLKRFVLVTKDAHELYRQYGGFDSIDTPENWLQRKNK
jgi:GNAT superfamily N-acetyltransferase